ncbi:MAG: class I SAM-dependent rRNA methyltransferase [Planctomycetota bacterium]|nr:MAG: class I SAM-dependent rRNA methyltransferase [Planctomycetota bacterium]
MTRPLTERRSPELLPDRPLDESPDNLGEVQLTGRHSPALIYDKMVDRVVGRRPRDGDLVHIVDGENKGIGWGLYNVRSGIRVRRLTRRAAVPDKTWWSNRIDDALDFRQRTIPDVVEGRTQVGQKVYGPAYRVIHAEGDGLPGLIVDRYDSTLSVECFSLGVFHRVGPILELIQEKLGTKHWIVRFDERAARAEGVVPQEFRSPNCPNRAMIQEDGVLFMVDFETGHKTGFFCDQRENRKRLTEAAAGKTLLDMCCYTGGFGLVGGRKASHATLVDLDETAVALAEENAKVNQYFGSRARYRFIQCDVFNYMRQVEAINQKFDVVVLDPPKLIGTRAEFEEGRRRYSDLNSLAMGLVEPGGLLVTNSCSGLMVEEEFLKVLKVASWRSGHEFRVERVTGAAIDHPVRVDVPESGYLKAVWLRRTTDEQ